MLVLVLAAAATTMVGASFVEVRSNTDCPSTADVTTRLRPMLPSGLVVGPDGDVADIEVIEARPGGLIRLRLQLLHADGSPAGDRRLVLQGSCAAKADALATIIAAWVPDYGPPPPPPPPPPAPPPPPPGPAGVALALGGSVGVAVVGGVAANASVEAAVGMLASRWQLRAAAATQTARQQTLDQGDVSWKHTTFAAGAVLGWRWPAWRFAVDAGPVLGLATLVGSGYGQNREQSVFEYGAGAGLRVERVFRRVALWLEWRTNVWYQRQRAVVDGTGSTSRQDLAGFDMGANLGASWLHFL